MGLGIKTAVKVGIASHRGSPFLRAVHRAAKWYEDAYENAGSDFNTNGERALLQRISGADFKTVFDVGANVGEWSENALKAWPTCHIHAFEVAPETAEVLSSRVTRLNAEANIHVHHCGASDKPGKMRMYYFPENPEMTCDAPRHAGMMRIPFDAEMITLDDFADARGIETVDFLKIDVEGGEHRVLDGFQKYIGANAVRLIQFEYSSFSIDSHVLLKDFYRRLFQRYWIGKIYPNGVDFIDYHPRLEDFRFCNYLCVSMAEPKLREMAGRL